MAENQFHVTGATSGAQVQTAYTAGILNVINDGPNTFDQRNPTNIILEKRGTEDSKANKIMERTISHFQSWNKNMVRTAALGQVLDKLNAGTTWLTIKGNPGEGKTTLAYMALEELHRCGRQVYEVRTPEEFKDVISTCPRPVIMLDDVLGSLEFDQIKWSNWAPALCPLLKEREHKSNEEEDQTSNKDVTVILIGRDYVLNSTSVGLGRLSVFLTSTKHCVCLDHSIERGIKEKRALWDRISKTSGVELDIMTVNKILEIEVPHGFPHVCRLFTTLYKENNAINACAFFTKPLEFLNESISNLFRDTNKVMLFKEMVKYEGEISKRELKKLDPTYKTIQVANELVGSYLKYVDDCVVFDHPSIYDSVAFQMCSLDPEFVIKLCHLSFIHERVRLHMTESTTSVSSSESRLVFEFDRFMADDLAKRFADEIIAQHFVNVLSHQAFTDRMFVSKVMSKVKTPLQSLLHLNDKTISQYNTVNVVGKKARFLAFVPSSKSPELLEYIDNCPDIELTEYDENDIFYCTCNYAASKVLLYLKKTRKSFNINKRFDSDEYEYEYVWKMKYESDNMTPLMVAAETSDVQFIQHILSLKPDLKARDSEGRTALHYLCKHGLAPVVSQVIRNACDVNSVDKAGLSVLSYACEYNHLDVVTLLIERGAIIDRCAFRAACRHGSLKIVQLLFENENPPGKKLVKTSLSAAFKSDIIDIEILDLLLAKGALINASFTGLPPLHTVCKDEKPLAAQWLLQQGVDVDRRDRKKCTALHHAAKISKECVDVLLNNGATVDVTNALGDTPLHQAAEIGCEKSVNALLIAGATVNITNALGNTPLHKAAKRGFKESVDVLLNGGAVVNAENKDGNTPLHQAAEIGCEESVNALLIAGATVNITNVLGNTPLHQALAAEYIWNVNALLIAGATVNITNVLGDTPLHYAAQSGFQESVDVLLKGGAVVHAENKDGDTPLHRAVLTWHRSSASIDNAAEGFNSTLCVELLLKAGAKVNFQNENGDSSLHLLCSRFIDWYEYLDKYGGDDDDKVVCYEVARLLIKYGADVDMHNNNRIPALHGALKKHLEKDGAKKARRS